MKNININFQKQTIEMTKTFANSASNYGSEAYNELMNAKRDFLLHCHYRKDCLQEGFLQGSQPQVHGKVHHRKVWCRERTDGNL